MSKASVAVPFVYLLVLWQLFVVLPHVDRHAGANGSGSGDANHSTADQCDAVVIQFLCVVAAFGLFGGLSLVLDPHYGAFIDDKMRQALLDMNRNEEAKEHDKLLLEECAIKMETLGGGWTRTEGGLVHSRLSESSHG